MSLIRLEDFSGTTVPTWARYAQIKSYTPGCPTLFFVEGDLSAGESPGQVTHIPCPPELMLFGAAAEFSVNR